MIQIGSYLNIVDNSGASIVKCFGLYKNKKFLKLSNIFIGSIKKLRKTYKNYKVKKGDIFKCILIQNKLIYKDKNNIKYRFYSNNAILINTQFLPLGTRIFSSILEEPFRKSKNYRLLSLSSNVII